MTAWSYVYRLGIGIIACHEHVPDIWKLADRFPAALAELRAAAPLAERQRRAARAAS